MTPDVLTQVYYVEKKERKLCVFTKKWTRKGLKIKLQFAKKC